MPITTTSLAASLIAVGSALAATPSPHLERIAPLPTDSAIPGVSDAVVVHAGRIVHLSGHLPFDADGKLVSTGLEPQLDQVFRNIGTTLQRAGATPSDLVRITILVRDLKPEQLGAIRAARDRFIDPQQPPASALIGVAALFHPDVLVEVDAIAVLPPAP